MPHSGQTGIFFDSGGHRLLGRLFLAAGDEPKPTAILLHGLPGIEQNHDLAHALRDHSWNAIIFHYRGCWGSGGLYSFKTLPDDVIACLGYFESGIHPQVDANRLVLIGHSMGGWAAILAAARDARPKAVCAIGAVGDTRPLPFADEPDEYVDFLPGLTREDFAAQWRDLRHHAGLRVQDQVEKIAPRPLLFVHSAQDDVVPVAQAREVFDQAGDPKRWITHPDANHSFTWHRPWLREQIIRWLDSLGF